MKVFKTLAALLILSVFISVSTGALAEEVKTPDTTTAVSASESGNASETTLIDINTAGLEQLVTLPGIGPSLADRIIKYRTEIGKFQKKEELISVKGIGQKKYEKISGMIITR